MVYRIIGPTPCRHHAVEEADRANHLNDDKVVDDDEDGIEHER